MNPETNTTWMYDELDGDTVPRPSVRVGGIRPPAPETAWRGGMETDRYNSPDSLFKLWSGSSEQSAPPVTNSNTRSNVGKTAPCPTDWGCSNSNPSGVAARSTSSFDSSVDQENRWTGCNNPGYGIGVPPKSQNSAVGPSGGSASISEWTTVGSTSQTSIPGTGGPGPSTLARSTQIRNTEGCYRGVTPSEFPNIPYVSVSSLKRDESRSGSSTPDSNSKVSKVMCVAKNGESYLSLPAVFSHVTFGGGLSVADRIDLGNIVSEYFTSDTRSRCGWPKVEIDSAWNPVVGASEPITIRKYDWVDYVLVANACLDWYSDNMSRVVY